MDSKYPLYALCSSVNRHLGGIHVQDRPVPYIHRFCSSDQGPVQLRQSGQVLLLGQHLGLEALQPRGQGCASIPNLLRIDQPKGWVLGKSLRIVEVFVTPRRLPTGDLLKLFAMPSFGFIFQAPRISDAVCPCNWRRSRPSPDAFNQ